MDREEMRLKALKLAERYVFCYDHNGNVNIKLEREQRSKLADDILNGFADVIGMYEIAKEMADDYHKKGVTLLDMMKTQKDEMEYRRLYTKQSVYYNTANDILKRFRITDKWRRQKLPKIINNYKET